MSQSRIPRSAQVGCTVAECLLLTVIHDTHLGNPHGERMMAYPDVSFAMRRCSGLLPTTIPGSPSTAVVQDSGSARACAEHATSSRPLGEARSCTPPGVRTRRRVTRRGGLPFEESAFERFTAAVPGTLVPSHLPKTCPWAPGYLEAWLLFSRIH